MGGVGVSNPQYWFLNNMNPALLTQNRITVFQAGMVVDQRRVYSDTLRDDTKGGNLSYLAMGFPLMRNKKTGATIWGTAFGLMPYSRVNYQYSYTDTTNGANGARVPVKILEEASGGFNEFYWSNGVRLNKYISVGLKTSFLFSSIVTDFSNYAEIPNQSVPYVISVYELQSVKGVRFTPGVHIRKDSIRRHYTFNFGATMDLGTKVKTSLEQFLDRKDGSGNILQSDTLEINEKNLKLNQNITVGATFSRGDRWTIGTDFTLLRPGQNFVTIGTDAVSVTNGWRFAFGAELTPDSRSLGSYLKRVTYRTGLSSESGTYLVGGNAVKDFGINFGLSLPVSRISSLDIAIRTGKRGNERLNGIQENYFKVYFGVTFNDQWFIKRRFD